MKLIIFAGGVGSRLWPLSRRNYPKQFDKIFNNKSTLQLAVSRIAPVFGYHNIYIQTSQAYKSQVAKQIPSLPKQNIIIEPERRNLAPAVCLSAINLSRQDYQGPLAILWADHLMQHTSNFIQALQDAASLIEQNGERFVFMAERPRFANNNLGWINVGRKLGTVHKTDFFKFAGWKYKPQTEECNKMFKSGKFFWNPGYFITSVNFLLDKYMQLASDIYNAVKSNQYQQAPKQSFDRAIIEHLEHREAVVLKTNLGWADPGTLYALKEALADASSVNVTQGQVFNLDTHDSLLYNLEQDKLLTTIGLSGMVVVNTKDAILVVHKDKVKQVTELVNKLEKEGLEEYL